MVRISFVMAGLLLVSSAALGQSKIPVVLDDPLPEGAERRFGSSRLRVADRAGYFMFTPDDKILIVGSADSVRFWDTATWKELWRTTARAFTCSPDGIHVARQTAEHQIEIWDMHKKSLVHKRDLGKFMRGMRAIDIEFSHDGAGLWVAAARDGAWLYDWKNDKVAQKIPAREIAETSLCLSRDRKVLGIRFDDGRFMLINGVTGEQMRVITQTQQVLWQQLDAKGTILALLTQGGNTHLFETATGQKLDWYPQDLIGRFAFDTGDRIIVTGEIEGAGSLSVVDVTKKKLVQDQPIEEGVPILVAVSHNNKLLAVGFDDGSVQVRDANTLKKIVEDPHPRGPATGVAFSPDGQLLATLNNSKAAVRVWNLRTPAPPASGPWKTFDVAFPADLSGMNSQLVFPSPEKLVLANKLRWNLETGARERVKESKEELVRISLDGRRALVGQFDDERFVDGLAIHEWAAGKELYKLPISLPADNYLTDPLSASFSADNAWLAMFRQVVGRRDPNTGDRPRGDIGIAVWKLHNGNKEGFDDKSGRPVLTLPVGENSLPMVHLSADGRLLVAVGEPSPENPHQAWHVPSGFLLWKVSGDEASKKSPPVPPEQLEEYRETAAATLSPDGQFLATTQGSKVQIREALSGQVVHTFSGQDGRIAEIAFSPDGRRLASAAADSTVVLWKIPEFPGTKPGVFRPQDAEAQWAALRGQASDAMQAMANFAAGGDEAATFLAGKLRPETDDERRALQQTIADLASPVFITREKATVRLEKWGYRFKPYLAEAVASATDLEQKRRLTALYERAKNSGIDPDELRVNRSVFVLERLAAAPVESHARAALESLARGPAQGLAAQSSRAALARLLARQRSAR